MIYVKLYCDSEMSYEDLKEINILFYLQNI